MRNFRIPDGNLLIPVESIDPDDGFGLTEICPEHPDYGRWCPHAEVGEKPRGQSQSPVAGT